jgi:mannose-6-phosphate isomerase-like protein (cupin superfamily)
MVKASIKHLDPDTEFYTDENCYIVEVSNCEADPDLSIARARVAPGVTTRWHRLDGIAERYVILSGQASVEIGALPPEPVEPGDVVLIPPLCRQRITNTGEADLIFLAICTPRFMPEAYENIDETPSEFGKGG